MDASEKPVIIYGGSFDPPHKGHMALAAAALRQLRPAALYFVPGWRTPFKDLRPVPFARRRAMLKKALAAAGLAARPEVKISSFENGRRRVVYTFETLEHFKKLHPGAPLYFLMGSDCLAGFRHWRRWRGILKTATLLAGLRPGHTLKGLHGVPFLPLRGRFPRAASSDLRAALFLGLRPPAVPAPVMEVIEGGGLYLARERRLLKELLSPARFRHSLAVAELALELAPRLGLPAQKAALAGLLHDCARELPPAALAGRVPREMAAGLQCGEIVRNAPVLLHAPAGAGLARRDFAVKDREILEAIALHATGAPHMGPLARLIYVCDLAAEGRVFREAGLVRRLARLDFRAAFRAANYVKLSYAFSGGGWVHPLSVSLWNSLQEKKKG
ncbi:MAG TPA: bis(5'-nucleosyl)-tetraphosphatase (symmetrical) YqeK [Elusimicrobiales bacterium]|nr:bis(5'-nucleosyl)-tetraphosphatase (symmetrical) YqeK [Elusimicrobiales bacterium]